MEREPQTISEQSDGATLPGEQGQPELDIATGQSLAGEQTISNPIQAEPGNAAPSEDSFFDPNDLTDELMPAYKQMQAAYTKKAQAIAAEKHKIEAYNNFEQNPMESLQMLAQQYGYQLIQGGQQPPQQGDENWEPQTWEEVLAKAEAKAEEKVLKRLEPLIGKVQQLQQSNTEQYLDNNFPDWRTYEDQMHENLKKHPTLANDPGTLYRMSVPDEVIKSRAAKSALQKIQANTANAQVSNQSTARQPATPNLNRPPSFNEAVEIARTRIQQGRGVSI